MKEIKIASPEGYEIDKEASTLECIKFKPVEKKNLTWEEIQKRNVNRTQFYLTSPGYISSCGLTEDIKKSRTHIPTERIAKKIRALCQLYIIAEYYNEGWEPDYSNKIEPKYFPLWFNDENSIKIDYLYISSGSFPIFKSKEVLLAAYEANKEIFETALKP